MIMREFHLQIVTPDGEVYNGQARSVHVRTSAGDVEILAGHADYFAPLGTGIAKVEYGDSVRSASASGGMLSVKCGEVKLVATTFEYSDEIDKARAERARERAEAAIRAAKDDKALRLAKARLSRALNRINASELK